MKVIFDEIESLQPYGYLIGRVPEEEKQKKGKLAQKISDFKDKVSKEGNEEEEE